MSERTPSRRTPAGARPRRAAAEARPYHHGSLPEALLLAAETVLQRDGLRGLTLRAIAREAGVSHTAPQHHFGDTAGVLSELAATGHTRLAETMSEHIRGLRSTKSKRKAIAHAYIEFAVEHPDLFRLMSRNELLDPDRPSLREARQVSARALASVFGAQAQLHQDGYLFDGIDAAQAVAITAGWGYVHGLASLLVDRRLERIASATGHFADARALVDAAIDRMQLSEDA
jgi:AcrR family transcriptional regulator